ncbi:MAG: MFS transporter [Pseudomonadota bacterium]|nr:MFS transporter [Pseudomonadota bacterium]
MNTGTGQSKYFYGWVIVAVGAILTFLGTGFYSYSRGVFLPSLAEELAHGSRFQIAMGFSVAAVTGAFLAPVLGRILDRNSPKRVILVGIGFVGLSYLLLSMTETIVQFYLVVGLGMGIGMMCMGNLAWHRTVISWFDHWRGRAIALGVLGASLAGVIMPPLVTALVETIGWRSAFVVFAATTVTVLVPLVIFLLKDRPEEIGEVRDGHRYVSTLSEPLFDDGAEDRLWHWTEMLKTRAFWSIALMFGSMGCVYSATMLHLFGHIKDIGLTASDAAYVLSITALFAALGKPVVGWMADAWGARVTIWMALVAQGLALLVFAYTQTIVVSLLAGSLYGFGYAGMSPLRTFALSVAIGNRSFGNANGVLRIVELPLVISASPLAGWVYDATGSYKIAFLILAGLMAVSCLGPFFIQAGGAKARRESRIEI